MDRDIQQPLPAEYAAASPAELAARIAAGRAAMGKRLLVLAHHYQRDEVVAHGDLVGDSFELARRAAERTDVDWVVFCGVHFMAESADILTRESVSVILPDMNAGCSMADMANEVDARACVETLTRSLPGRHIVPITYVNSSAAVKAVVGEYGGAVCTSSNCRKILEWALAGGQDPADKRRVLVVFLPDQHLGRNTAWQMGFDVAKMRVWNPAKPLGGNAIGELAEADFVLWKGHCSVHQLFTPAHADAVRKQYPGMRVIVHPEVCHELARIADDVGSTSHIVSTIEKSQPGSMWAVGTEANLVGRLARRFPDRKIISLSDCQCLCSTMFRISAKHLCWAIDRLVAGKPQNVVRVPKEMAEPARVALQRMLTISAKATR